uniref:RING-type domain-containing protein n=1 Tax=Trichogramma kaykai TaxID=54128 RepID=A0ABD2WBP3_9HYME
MTLISAFIRIERLERDAPPAPVVEEVELSNPATPSSFANRDIEENVVYDFNEQPSTSRANSREEESDDDTPMLPSFVRAARLRRFLSSETLIEAETHDERSEADQIEEVAHSETAMEIETREIAQSNGTETDEERSEAEVEEVNSAFNRIEQMDEVAPAEQRTVVPAEQGAVASAEHAALAPVVLPRQAEIAPQRKKRKRGCKSKCLLCESKSRVQKLRPCGHRMCVPCIISLLRKTCPSCRVEIDTYLDPSLMGNELWELNLPLDWRSHILHLIRDLEYDLI